MEVSIEDLVDSEGADAVDPATADDGPAPVDNSVRGSLARWLSFAVPISIALVAILGAVVGYRAEYHASLSGASGTDALVSSTYASGHVYDALLTGQLAVTEHDQWERLSGAAGHGTGPAMVAAAEPACADNGPDASSVTAAEQSVNCQLAQVFSALCPSRLLDTRGPRRIRHHQVRGGLGGTGQPRARRGRDPARGSCRRPEPPGVATAVAGAGAGPGPDVLHLGAGRTRTTGGRHRTSRTSLLLAIPGWILLAGCTAVLLVWEV